MISESSVNDLETSLFFIKSSNSRQSDEKLVHRLIHLFSSTEILVWGGEPCGMKKNQFKLLMRVHAHRKHLKAKRYKRGEEKRK